MNNFKKLLISAALLSGASVANAQVTCNGATQCTGPASELIQGLFPLAAGGIAINSPATVNGLPCAGNTGPFNVLLPDTHANYRETYAALLTASVSGNDVQLRIDTNEANCVLQFARFLN